MMSRILSSELEGEETWRVALFYFSKLSTEASQGNRQSATVVEADWLASGH